MLINIRASLVAQLVKNPPAIWETWVRSLGWEDLLEKGTSAGEGNSYPLQYSDLENSIDCIVPGVARSRTRLSNFHFLALKLTLMLINIINIIIEDQFQEGSYHHR